MNDPTILILVWIVWSLLVAFKIRTSSSYYYLEKKSVSLNFYFFSDQICNRNHVPVL